MSRIRIASGLLKGIYINLPKADIRPTQDKVRSALFNIIKMDIAGARFLDLFAGSGAVGIEALSQGASRVVLVDNNRSCIKTIRENIALVSTEKALPIEVYQSDAFDAIEQFSSRGDRFDIIFCDPPYYKDMAKNSLIKIAGCDSISENACVILEHFKKDDIPNVAARLKCLRQYQYGDTVLSVYRKTND